MAEQPNVIPGEPVEADWGNDVRDRSIQRYASQAALDLSVPFPGQGETVWLNSPPQLQVWSGAAWIKIQLPDDVTSALLAYLPLSGGTISGALTVQGLATFTQSVNAQSDLGVGGLVNCSGDGIFGGRLSAQVFDAWLTLTPQSTWVPFGAGEQEPRIRRDAATDLVTMQFSIKDGITDQGAVIFTLPNGLEPRPGNLFFAGMSNDKAVGIKVNNTGTVQIRGGNDWSSVYASFSCHWFTA